MAATDRLPLRSKTTKTPRPRPDDGSLNPRSVRQTACTHDRLRRAQDLRSGRSRSTVAHFYANEAKTFLSLWRDDSHLVQSMLFESRAIEFINREYTASTTEVRGTMRERVEDLRGKVLSSKAAEPIRRKLWADRYAWHRSTLARQISERVDRKGIGRLPAPLDYVRTESR